MTARQFLPVSAALVLVAALSPMSAAAQQHISWGDSVPAGWHGQWPAELRTYAEQSQFTRTMTTAQLHEYINTLKWKSDRMHVISMFTSPLGKVAPAMVLSKPRVTSPKEAREFPAGSFFVDTAQRMANAAFYYLEPRSRDGFVGWGVLDDRLHPGEYPIFKYRREVNPR